jgi:hypothetical protein
MRGATEGAVLLTYDPEQRGLGIVRLQERLGEHPEDRHARHALARALAWSGRHDEALAHYDQLLEDAPAAEARTLLLERLEVLTWKGETRQAMLGYRSMLATRPHDVDARLGLARALRWSGRPLAGRWHARKASRLAADERAAREELAWSYAAAGEPAAARRILGETPPSEELAHSLGALQTPRVGAAVPASGNSFDIQRVALRSAIRVPLPFDLGLEIGSGMTHVRQGDVHVNYGVAGVAMSAAIDRLELRAGAGAYGATDHHGVDGHARATVHVVDELQVGLGYRHRPFLENATPESTGEPTYHGAGVGPTQVLAETLDLQLDQITASLNALPRSWVYIYGEANYMWLRDGNRGFTVSTGLGANVLGYWKTWPVSLYGRWDAFMAGFDEVRTGYFAPGFLDVHSVGLDLRARLWKLELGANGGGTFPLFAQASSGWYGGGTIALGTDRISTVIRGDYRADAFFEQWRAWLMLDVSF